MSIAASSAPEATAGLWSPRYRSLTVGLVLTITLVAFEALAVATIMPIVGAELGNPHLYGWVFTSFFLGSLLGIVVVGGVIDRGGLVKPFLAGLILFSIGLVIGGITPSMEVLVAGRFLQGLGGGAIPPVAYVAIGRALPESLRARMFATMSTAWVLPGVIGPAISGIVAETIHWRAVFLGLLPLIVIAGAMTIPALVGSAPDPRRDDEGDATSTASEMRRRLPWAFVVTAGAALVVAGLTDAQLIPGLPLVIAGLAIGIPAFRHLTPPGTLRAERGLPAAVLLRGMLTFSFFCADAYVPLALVQWRGLGAATAGIALTSATLAWTAGAWVQAPRFTRIGPRRFVTIGFMTVAIGVLGFTVVLNPAVPVVIGFVLWGVAGFGMGLSYSPLSLVALAEAPPGGEGTATSGLQLSDVVGTALGTGVGGSIIAASNAAGLEPWVGLAGAFGVGVVVAVVGSTLARRLPGPRRRPSAPHGATAPLG
ncbi:MAG: MFS transporter [Chloroflexota bacterium]